MKSLVAAAVIVVVLVAAGEGLRRAAIVQDALATAAEQLTTTGAVSRDAEEALDAAVALGAGIPFVGASLDEQVRVTRAMQAYWQREYGALSSGPLAPAPTDITSTLQLLAANAAFRQLAARREAPQVLARSLDDVLKGYEGVLDRDPANDTAAHNYEFVGRLRSALSGGRSSGLPPVEPNDMQGDAGDPPEGTRKSDFNVIVPLRPEERQEQLDPGSGAEFKRRG